MKLNLSDYKKILDFYKINYAHMKNSTIKKKAESMLANKLCRCIKKVKKKEKHKQRKESNAIGVCKKSVITRKNLKINKFKCKNGPKLINKANSKVKLMRTGTLKHLSKKHKHQTKKNKKQNIYI